MGKKAAWEKRNHTTHVLNRESVVIFVVIRNVSDRNVYGWMEAIYKK